MKKKKKDPFPGFTLVPGSVGIILDSIWQRNDGRELIIKSAFGGMWRFGEVDPDDKNLIHPLPPSPHS